MPELSHVLLAMGVPEREARGALRITLGHDTTDADVDQESIRTGIQEAVADLEDSKRLSPRDPVLASWNTRQGVASLMLGREAEALGHLMRAVALQPGNDARTLNLASAYALLGRMSRTPQRRAGGSSRMRGCGPSSRTPRSSCTASRHELRLA